MLLCLASACPTVQCAAGGFPLSPVCRRQAGMTKVVILCPQIENAGDIAGDIR